MDDRLRLIDVRRRRSHAC